MVSGSLTRWPTLAKNQGANRGSSHEGHGGDRPEQGEPQVVVGEDDAERQHRAEVVHEAGGEDDLAESRSC